MITHIVNITIYKYRWNSLLIYFKTSPIIQLTPWHLVETNLRKCCTFLVILLQMLLVKGHSRRWTIETFYKFIEYIQTRLRILTRFYAFEYCHRVVLCCYRGHSTSISLGKRKDEDKKWQKWHGKRDVQPKKWCVSHKFFDVIYLITQSFPLGFSCSPGNITESNKKNTSKSLSVYPR